MNYLKYKKFILLFAWCQGILFLMAACNSPVNNYRRSEIESIANKWVPDDREGICSITVAADKGATLILRGETTVSQAKQEIIELFKNGKFMFVDSILLLPDTIKNSKYMGLVSLSVINLRKEPDHRAELVSQSILGTPVMVLKSKNGWVLIQTPDKYIAWTERSSITVMSSSEMANWRHSNRIIFMENSGWIYSSPDESATVGDLVAGCIMKKAGESKGFAKVILPDGREGYVKNEKVLDFISWETEVKCTEENVCRIASTFLGLPYLWGGTSTKGVDCSGFVQSVFFMNGIILSRDASLQARHGLNIDISNGFSQLKKGDLLFFGPTVNSKPRVTHVAIYDGDSEYINSSGRVMVNSLDSTRNNYNYRKRLLLSAKRIIGVDNDKGIVDVGEQGWY